VVFDGTFTAGRLEIAVADGQLLIVNDGNVIKFVQEVEHRTFSGDYASKRGQPALYVTERCVFELTPEGLELTEVAPGIDIERDILARMAFRPTIRRDPSVMDQRIFSQEPMGLREDLLRMRLERRFSITPSKNSSSSISKAMSFEINRTSNRFAASLKTCSRRWGARSTSSSTTIISESPPT
jgi:propionate CoA-transferase